MSIALPASIVVLERGWLSANNILCCDGESATLIDSGYVSHATQTVALVRQALGQRRLKQLINTHSHSDHIGGNAAVQAAFGCEISVPAGLHADIADWDRDALLLSPLGQQAARFQHDQLISAGDTLTMGELTWQTLAVPGHDMEALAFYNPDKRLLISGDALWENGFGVIFPELLGQAAGLAATRQTLEALGRLSIDAVIPGHGSPFGDVDAALSRANQKLTAFEADIERLAWHAIKVIVAFAMLERRRIRATAFADFVLALPFARDVNQRIVGLPDDLLVERLERELIAAGALQLADGHLAAPG